MASLLKLKAKAIVAARLKKESREALIKEVRDSITLPTPEAGRDGRDAPELSEILESIKGMLPTPQIEQVTNTIVQKIDEGDLSGMVQEMLDAKVPEIEKSLRPKVELIREDVSDEKLEGFVSKKVFDEALQRIQQAITYHSGGGKQSPEQLIETVTEDTIVKLQDHTFLIDASGGPVTMTLPAAALSVGQRFNFKKIDTTVNKVTLIDTTSTIDDQVSVTIDLYLDEIPVRSDRTEYWII